MEERRNRMDEIQNRKLIMRIGRNTLSFSK